MTFFDLRQIYGHLERIGRHIDGSYGPGEGQDFARRIKRMEQLLMALDQNVQELINQVANNSSLVASAIAALKAESTQIADLQAQIAAIVPGQPIDAEDLAALQKAASDLKDTNTQLQTAVPASTPGA